MRIDRSNILDKYWCTFTARSFGYWFYKLDVRVKENPVQEKLQIVLLTKFSFSMRGIQLRLLTNMASGRVVRILSHQLGESGSMAKASMKFGQFRAFCSPEWLALICYCIQAMDQGTAWAVPGLIPPSHKHSGLVERESVAILFWF